ncbi:ATP synthase subunit [Novosphingobium sp. PC22D]|uniref:AtpZ/AtpI family protein n=1 Tax=Novosphingobium sp. PC22D TaxID=1962403 RepID=UPI000BFABC77|nr:AtpZ/AtpI family protein [Novosphingobium sp. PC22D]PEQ11596.1 ATP synthase subunit [Novosphingobium sp. PC22D]
MSDQGPDPMASAARRARRREEQAGADPEPSLGVRLGQIGVLGWMVVLPMLAALALGRWIDHRFGTGIFFSAPALMIGAGLGFTTAWRWMHRRL